MIFTETPDLTIARILHLRSRQPPFAANAKANQSQFTQADGVDGLCTKWRRNAP